MNARFEVPGICSESLFLAASLPDQRLLPLTLLDLTALFLFPQELVLKAVGVVQWAGGSETLTSKIRASRRPYCSTELRLPPLPPFPLFIFDVKWVISLR